MAFIGREPVYGAYHVQTLVPDSNKFKFNLDFTVGSAASIMIYYGGIYQIPGSAYGIDDGGNTVIFSEPPEQDISLTVIYLGHQLTIPRQAESETVYQTFIGDGVTTNFVLEGTPATPSGILVFVDGVYVRTGFSIIGSSIIFITAPLVDQRIDVHVINRERIGTSTIGSGSISADKLSSELINNGTWNYIITNQNYFAKFGDFIFVDTTGGIVNISLPSSPNLGNRIMISDVGGSFDVNRCVILRNNNNIMGLPENLDVTTKFSSFQLIYSNQTYGWRLIGL
jgi:hypothetical protein